MSRSSGERPATEIGTEDRAAVEPVAALVAVLAVGAALGLYVVALDDAAPDRERPVAEEVLDRVEPAVTVGGVVDPERLGDVDGVRPTATVELAAADRTWRVSGDEPPEASAQRESPKTAIAERTVTVRVAPGRNARGRLRAVVRR